MGATVRKVTRTVFLVGVDVTMIAAKRSIYGWIGVRPKN
jgi:hypothetical protein